MPDIQAYHNSQEKDYRDPFGARPCGEEVTLRLTIPNDSPPVKCYVLLKVKDEETARPMRFNQRRVTPNPKAVSIEAGSLASHFRDGMTLESTITLPREPGLLWYLFEIRAGGETYYYHNNEDELGGEGVLSRKKGPPFQITVYKPAAVPLWLKDGIMYQIYVDRFFNGCPDGRVLNPKKKSLIHAHWDDTPLYVRNEKGRVARWSFFGGNLHGVIAKLPYLQELGITIIYFNPIFEASSNHKYDTGDYLKVDPMYGDLATFMRLTAETAKMGISVILDGVFSHTGADSRYFNRYGHYPELGAYQAEVSPYYSWYRLKRPAGPYESWWGEEDLPNVNEMDPSYRDFMLGENGVVKFWLQKGVRGWRLDVADELPDAFIKLLRRVVKETDPEAVLIGEVWEDASHKVSYGVRREYFHGDELDSVMNYPLRLVLLRYMLHKIGAKEAVSRMMSLYENYPPENFRATMNIVGSHDRIRALTLLGDAPAERSLTVDERESFRLSAPARERAAKRLKLAALLQMTLPGVPCIYYGDEAGLEGYSDPFNRGTYPWGKEDRELRDWHKRLVWLRKEYDVLRRGSFEPFSVGDDILGFRSRTEGEEIIVCVNRDSFEEATVNIDLNEDFSASSSLVLELLSGERLSLDSPAIKTTLRPLEGKVFYVSRRGIQKAPEQASLTMEPSTPECSASERSTTEPPGPLPNKQRSVKPGFSVRSSGILLHITSLPSRWGIGDMGKEAERFVDFLTASGQTLWQVLPLNPTGLGNSPYTSPSVMAGYPLLISPDRLQEEGLLTEADIQNELGRLTREASEPQRPDKVDYPLVGKVKERLFRRAWTAFRNQLSLGVGNRKERQAFEDFVKPNEYWLDDYSLFMAFKKRNENLPWIQWDKDAAQRDTEALNSARKQMAEEIEYQLFLQYVFSKQWRRLKEYANDRGVKIVGDVPIYVDADSCCTWANRKLFKLDSDGRPLAVAGVPPDYYSKSGQLWGNPVYDWRQMEKDDYLWWKRRIRQALSNCDYLRLDHFRGFEGFWEVQAGESTALNGRWLKGPGKRFFETLRDEFGELPFIAEDLGFITPEVHNLRNILGLPGMRVYQFGDPPDTADGDAVYYSGTHDNDTLIGWYENQDEHHVRLTPQDREALARKTLRDIYAGGANWVIVPMQDILSLGGEARMNTPGTVESNWTWRMKKDDLTDERREWLKSMAVESGRYRQ